MKAIAEGIEAGGDCEEARAGRARLSRRSVGQPDRAGVGGVTGPRLRQWGHDGIPV